LVEHLSQIEVEDYSQHRLGLEQLLSVSDHLAECEACRRRIESEMRGDEAFLALRSELFDQTADSSSPRPERTHLSAEQAGGYVDRSLSGEEHRVVADHLSGCQQCAVGVEDLKSFREQIAPWLEGEYHPATVASPTEGRWHRAVASVSARFRGTRFPSSSRSGE
jgi:anti-sigma factor RsiW